MCVAIIGEVYSNPERINAGERGRGRNDGREMEREGKVMDREGERGIERERGQKERLGEGQIRTDR